MPQITFKTVCGFSSLTTLSSTHRHVMSSEMCGSLHPPGAVAMPLLVEAVDWTSFLEPDGGCDFPAVETPGSKVARIRIKPSGHYLESSSPQFPGQHGWVHEVHCFRECFWMQIFWNAGTDVFYKTWPLLACCDLRLVDRNQRLEDSS